MQRNTIARLADFAFKLHDGHLDEVVVWLQQLGCRDVHRGEGDAAVTGLTGVRVGLCQSDPVTCAVLLGFAVAGPFWPHAYPGLLKEVNRRWAERRKLAKAPAPPKPKQPEVVRLRLM